MKKALTLLTTPPLLLIASNPVSAQEIALSIKPQITGITALPGETVETKLTVRNDLSIPVQLQTLIRPFTSSSEDNGQVTYVSDNPQFLSHIQIHDTGTPITNITLGPKEEKNLTIHIKVPENESSKDHYFSVIILTIPQNRETPATDKDIQAYSSVSGGVASHFLVSVDPKLSKQLQLEEFSSPPLSRMSPVPFTVRVTNETNHFSRPSGEIQIQNILGSVVETISIPPSYVLSHSVRALTTTTNKESTRSQNRETEQPFIYQEKSLFPGIYKAKISLEDTRSNNPIDKTIYFMVAPLELIISLIVFTVFIYLLKKRLKERSDSL